METCISNSLSFCSLIHQFRLGWDRENILKNLKPSLLPELNLMRIFAALVTKWGFPLSIWRLESRDVFDTAIHTICPYSLVGADCLQSQHISLLSSFPFSMGLLHGHWIFPKQSFKSCAWFSQLLIAFLIRFAKMIKRNRKLSYCLTPKWHVVIILPNSLKWMKSICISKQKNIKVK